MLRLLLVVLLTDSFFFKTSVGAVACEPVQGIVRLVCWVKRQLWAVFWSVFFCKSWSVEASIKHRPQQVFALPMLRSFVSNISLPSRMEECRRGCNLMWWRWSVGGEARHQRWMKIVSVTRGHQENMELEWQIRRSVWTKRILYINWNKSNNYMKWSTLVSFEYSSRPRSIFWYVALVDETSRVWGQPSEGSISCFLFLRFIHTASPNSGRIW